MAEDIGSVFNTKVPSYTEAADIRKAFNLYHYGTEIAPVNEEQVVASSIAGYLKALNEDIDRLEAGISNVIQLEANQDLDDIFQNGVYLSASNPSESLGYPTADPGSNSDNGILQVVSKVDPINSSRLFVFQRYQTLGIVGGSEGFLPKLYWRSGSRVNNVITWTSSWREASINGHLHNDTYYTIAQIDNKVNTTLDPSRAAVVDSSSKLASSIITTAELNKLDGADNLAGTIEAELNDRSRITHLHDDRYYVRSDVSNPQPGAQRVARIYVQQAAPTGAQVNDLWFW